MNVYKKLMQARIKLQGMELKKSGENKFAGYKYFELADFLPQTMQIFHDLGLASIVSFNSETACLVIRDVEDGSEISICSPMADANLKGAHPIQNLGAVESYQRRYLWLAAMEIVEHDIIDASAGAESLKPTETKVKPVAGSDAPKPPKKVSGKPGSWQLSIGLNEDGDSESWVTAVMDMLQTTLEFATTSADVREIFKVNREIWDNLKSCDAAAHDKALVMFRDAKNKLEG